MLLPLIVLLYFFPFALSHITLDKRQALASSACGNRDQTVSVCSPSPTDVWYNNTYHELTWKYNNPVFNGFETLTFYLLQQNSSSHYQQIKSFDVVHAVGVQVVLIDDSWYPSPLANNSPNVTRNVFAYLIGSGVNLQTELANPLSIYPRPSQFTLIQNSHNTTTSTPIPTPSSSSTDAPQQQQQQQNSNLPVWAIVIIVIAAVAVTIAAIAVAWLIRNIRRNREREQQSKAIDLAPPNNMSDAPTPMPVINNRIRSPHINTNDLSSSIHSSTPMLHGSIRDSPTAPSPSSLERSPSLLSNPMNPHDHQPTTTNSILSSTDALMIADTFRQFLRKPDWSDAAPPNHADETEEQKQKRSERLQDGVKDTEPR